MSDIRDPERDQVAPVPNSNPSCHDLVIADLEERKQHGLRKYNSLLQAGNGRSMLQDAYEEVMDLAVYLKGALEEERMRNETVAAVRADTAAMNSSTRDPNVTNVDGKLYVTHNLDDLKATIRLFVPGTGLQVYHSSYASTANVAVIDHDTPGTYVVLITNRDSETFSIAVGIAPK